MARQWPPLLLALVILGTCVVLGDEGESHKLGEWLALVGGKLHPNVEVRPAPADDNQPGVQLRLFTTGVVKEGEELIVIPLSHVLWRGTTLGDGLPPAATALFSVLLSGRAVAPGTGPSHAGEALVAGSDPEEVCIALFLLAQRGLGEHSRWRPFVHTLPTSLRIPATFSASALAALQDPLIAGYSRHAAMRHRRLHSQLTPAMKRLARFIGLKWPRPGKMTPQFPFSAESFQWAMSLIEGRALTLRGQRYLVPVADLIAYAPHVATRVAAQGSRFLRYHKVERRATGTASSRDEDAFVVLADRTMQPGELVTEDYGDAPSHVLFQHHGLLPAENPFDCARLPVPSFIRLMHSDPESVQGNIFSKLFPFERVSQTRAQLFEQLDVQVSPSVCVRPGSLPHHLTAGIALAFASEEALPHCETLLASATQVSKARVRCVQHLLGTEVPLVDEDDPLRVDGGQHAPLLARVNQVVATMADSVLQSFPTTLEEDKLLLAASRSCGGISAFCVTLPGDELAAVTFRVSRKQILSMVSSYYREIALQVLREHSSRRESLEMDTSSVEAGTSVTSGSSARWAPPASFVRLAHLADEVEAEWSDAPCVARHPDGASFPGVHLVATRELSSRECVDIPSQWASRLFTSELPPDAAEAISLVQEKHRVHPIVRLLATETSALETDAHLASGTLPLTGREGGFAKLVHPAAARRAYEAAEGRLTWPAAFLGASGSHGHFQGVDGEHVLSLQWGAETVPPGVDTLVRAHRQLEQAERLSFNVAAAMLEREDGGQWSRDAFETLLREACVPPFGVQCFEPTPAALPWHWTLGVVNLLAQGGGWRGRHGRAHILALERFVQSTLKPLHTRVCPGCPSPTPEEHERYTQYLSAAWVNVLQLAVQDPSTHSPVLYPLAALLSRPIGLDAAVDEKNQAVTLSVAESHMAGPEEDVAAVGIDPRRSIVPQTPFLTLGLCRSSPTIGWQLSRLRQAGILRMTHDVPLPLAVGAAAEILDPGTRLFLGSVAGDSSAPGVQACLRKLAHEIVHARRSLKGPASAAREWLGGFYSTLGVPTNTSAVDSVTDYVTALGNSDVAVLHSLASSGEHSEDGDAVVCARDEPAVLRLEGAPRSGCGVCVRCANALRHDQADDWMVL
jgi:hypothetical protein